MKTYQPTQIDIKRNWHLIDANDMVLGRIASKIAVFLIGKHKPNYYAHMDSGDFVVVINCEKVKVTGKKEDQKVYRSHSGYPGGFKEVGLARIRKEHPERIIEHAVNGMLPDNRLKSDRMRRLKLVVGEKNPYSDKVKNKEVK